MREVEIASIELQCSDNADLVVLFATSLGVEAKARFISDNDNSITHAPIRVAGSPNVVKERDSFMYHQVVIAGDKVYDPSIKSESGSSFLGIDFAGYMESVFPGEHNEVHEVAIAVSAQFLNRG